MNLDLSKTLGGGRNPELGSGVYGHRREKWSGPAFGEKKMGGQGSLFFILFLHFVVCRERISTNLCSYRQIYLPLSSGSQSSFVQFEIRRTGAEFVRNAFRFDLKSKKSPNARSTHKYIHKITEKCAETDCQQLRLLLQFFICLLKYIV